MNKPEAIIIHHEGANNGFEAVDRYHKTRWPDFKSQLGYYVGYQWYYDKNKQEWIQARKEDEEGAHTLGGWNRKGIALCLEGNYDLEQFELSNQLKEKIKDVRSRWGRLPVKTHGEVWETKCPGKNLQKWVDKFREQEKIPTDPPEPPNHNKILWGLITQLVEIIKQLQEKLKNKSC